MKKTYGKFEVLQPIASSPGKALYSAKDATTEGYVVKVLHLAHFADGNPEKVEALSHLFYRTTELQKKVAEQSKAVLPILLYGMEGEAAWYATTFYPNSVQKLLAARVQLTKEQIHQVIDAVLRGALDFKQHYGRSHGNLKPSNILCSGNGKPSLGKVVLTDPSPGDGAMAERFEVADLRAVGELIYRLAHPTDARNPDLWRIPAEPTPDWVAVFGDSAKTWVNLCARLLDIHLSVHTFTLEKLALELLSLNPKRTIKPAVLAASAAALVLLGAGVGVFLWKGSTKPEPAQASKAPPATVPATTTKSEEEARRAAAEAKVAAAKAEAEVKASEERRLQAEAEVKRLAEEKRLAELKSDSEAKRRAEAAQKAAEEKLAQMAAERAAEEDRIKAAAELARKKDEEARIELQFALAAKREAAEKAAEQERLREEAEARTRTPSERENALTPAKVAAATSAALSKPQSNKRWSNSLGMRFVPIGEGRILICVWETRVKDYDQFVRAARHNSDSSWKNPGFTQTPPHPVVNVSAGDAESFCRWLTDTERAAGLLSDVQFYRLPTETEWSLAAQTHRGLTYPWGGEWPPPIGVGNLAQLCTYDRYEQTSPTGQFLANATGVFDLVGNVWEMCQSPSRGGTVCRGGSWKSASSGEMLVSYVQPLGTSERRFDIGFRCVLDTGGK